MGPQKNRKRMGTARLNHKCGRQLASGTASDLGLWSPEQKSVSKRKAELYLTFIALCFLRFLPCSGFLRCERSVFGR